MGTESAKKSVHSTVDCRPSSSALWTHEEAAAYLKIKPKTLYGWIADGVGPPSMKLGRATRRYDPEAVRAWARDHLRGTL